TSVARASPRSCRRTCGRGILRRRPSVRGHQTGLRTPSLVSFFGIGVRGRGWTDLDRQQARADLGVRDAGIVVDDGVDERGPHLRLPVLASGDVLAVAAIGVALQSADVTVSASVGDVAEFRHVDMDQRSRMRMLVTPERLAGNPVDMGETIDTATGENGMNRRRGEPEPAGDLRGTEPEAPAQRDNALLRRLGRL